MRSLTPKLIRDVLQETFHIFIDSHCLFGAAALAYFALLSLIPFFILTASLIGFLVAGVDVAQGYILVAENTERFLPFLEGDLESSLLELVEARNITGLIGVGSLIGTATMFFLTIEQAFSAIFPASADRGFWRSKGLAVGLIPAVVALLGFFYYGFLVIDRVIGVLSVPVVERLLESTLMVHAISTAILAVEFCLLIYWFERGSVRVSNIAVGATVFSVLWLLALAGFRFYVQSMATFSIIYGSLGALVVLVLWIYYVALVFLVGCCVTEALRRRQHA